MALLDPHRFRHGMVTAPFSMRAGPSGATIVRQRDRRPGPSAKATPPSIASNERVGCATASRSTRAGGNTASGRRSAGTTRLDRPRSRSGFERADWRHRPHADRGPNGASLVAGPPRRACASSCRIYGRSNPSNPRRPADRSRPATAPSSMLRPVAAPRPLPAPGRASRSDRPRPSRETPSASNGSTDPASRSSAAKSGPWITW